MRKCKIERKLYESHERDLKLRGPNQFSECTAEVANAWTHACQGEETLDARFAIGSLAHHRVHARLVRESNGSKFLVPCLLPQKLEQPRYRDRKREREREGSGRREHDCRMITEGDEAREQV